jgi:hypothetical protein
MNKEEWYKQRDDRTNRIDGINLHETRDVVIGVLVGEIDIENYSNQVMALAAVNILSRWASNLTISCPKEAKCNIPGSRANNLHEEIEKTISASDPFGNFQFRELSEINCDVTLVIGRTDKNIEGRQIWIDSSNWLAGYGTINKNNLKKKSHSKNPIGPVFAACLGNSEIFKLVNGIESQNTFVKWYSLLDFSSSQEPGSLSNQSIPEQIDFGRLLQIGCGAVGSSLCYILGLTEYTGEIFLTDFDRIDAPNCSSSLLFSAKNAFDNDLKTNVCHNYLKNSAIRSTPIEGDFSTVIGKNFYTLFPPDAILCLANERQIWSAIQWNYPPLTLHATTSPNWGINLGRHIPLHEWCLVCRFGVKEHVFVPQCATGVISQNNQEEKLGSLPFLSPASAIFILAELIKLQDQSFPLNKNFIQFSLRPSGNAEMQQMNKKPLRDCPVCSLQEPSIYPKSILASKYWR